MAELLCAPQFVSGPRGICFSKTSKEMLPLHSIIVFGALLAGSSARSNPHIIVAEPDGEESNEIPGFSEEVATGDLVETNDTNVCQTEECRLIGQELLKSLNKSVDPCEDFYEYACGGWIANHPVPASELFYNQFTAVAESNQKRIREILEEPEEDTDIAPVKAAKQFYRSCMNLEALEEMGLKPLEIILEENGGWPMTMGSSEPKRNGISWQQIHDNYLGINGQAILYRFKVKQIGDDVYWFKMSPPRFTLSRSMLIDREEHKSDMKAYAKYVKKVALAFAKSRNSNVTPKEISKDVKDLINFETELAKIKLPESDDLTIILLLETLYDESSSENKKMDWAGSIQNLFNVANIEWEDIGPIIYPGDEYLLNVTEVLEKTPERTIVNYLHWRFVDTMLSFTNKNMRNLRFKFQKRLFGTEKQQPRWQQCVSENLLEDAVSYMFGQKYFSEESKKKVFEMIREIKGEVENEISLSNFINNDTKSEAVENLMSITPLVGVSDWYNNDSAIIDFHKGLEVGRSYFHNVLNCNKFLMKKALRNIRQPMDHNNWNFDPVTTNAAYDPSDNSIEISAGILQPPFFSASQPNPVNYGGIGAVIGHEISHAYNSFAREHNRNQCFVDQFNKYPIGELEILKDIIDPIGETTQDDNIADSAGLQAAYKAYQSKLAAEGKTENKIPGLEDFSGQQIFFLSFANSWCESLSPTGLLFKVLLDDEHSIGRFRVIGSVSNTPGFSEAFQCPAGSPMNPEVKCKLWD